MPRRPADAEGPLPTIGSLRARGSRGLVVTCTVPLCRHTGNVAFDALGMADDVVLIDVPKDGRLKCSVCGRRQVQVVSA